MNCKRIIEKSRRIVRAAAVSITAVHMTAVSALASGDVAARIQQATTTIQGILTSCVAGVGICVSIFILLKKMPDADNPHEKHELYRGVGRVWGLVALAGACIWIVPWFYTLFTS